MSQVLTWATVCGNWTYKQYKSTLCGLFYGYYTLMHGNGNQYSHTLKPNTTSIRLHSLSTSKESYIKVMFQGLTTESLKDDQEKGCCFLSNRSLSGFPSKPTNTVQSHNIAVYTIGKYAYPDYQNIKYKVRLFLMTSFDSSQSIITT